MLYIFFPCRPPNIPAVPAISLSLVKAERSTFVIVSLTSDPVEGCCRTLLLLSLTVIHLVRASILSFIQLLSFALESSSFDLDPPIIDIASLIKGFASSLSNSFWSFSVCFTKSIYFEYSFFSALVFGE